MAKRVVRTGLNIAVIGFFVTGLTACGGGGSDSDSGGTPPPPPTGSWTAGVFQPSATFKDQCARPRTGTRPNGQPYPDIRGSILAENNWLRSWTNELYLWYDEVVDRNPANYPNPLDYFEQLRTTAVTSSGAPKDQYHFTVPTAEWEAFSQSGVSAGYGAEFRIVRAAPPREVRILYVEPNSPASAEGLRRNDEILRIDNEDVMYGNNVDVLNAGLLPERPGESHTFQVRDANGSTRNVTMVSAEVESTPVHTVRVIDTPSGPVGYLLFNNHIATAEDGLIDAITTLRDANIVDLVLDVRYNGGGYLAIASQLAYMIAGSARTGGRVFERSTWNDKHPTTNPVTGQPLAPMPFIDETLGFSRPQGASLPTLNLPQARVYVLTSSGTCSASEAIINGLRGIDFEVIQIGTTTCGKPYGFYDFDNCGTTYFSVQFKAANAKGFGDYADGFSPANTQVNRGTIVPGCSVADDLSYELGDSRERMLSVTLSHRMSGACALPPAGFAQNKRTADIEEGAIARPAYREMRILRDMDMTP